MRLHLFGAATPSGEAFRQSVASQTSYWSISAYSRTDPLLLPVDFCDPAAFRLGGETSEPSIFISFGPIWLFAHFLKQLADELPDSLLGLHGVIACSSSSVITKRFAANSFDRELVALLTAAEDQLLATCLLLDLPCRILRPTLIYGRVGPYVDFNLSRLVQLMRRLPVLPVPLHTGQRQPIHASQLAAVVLEFARQFVFSCWDPQSPPCISLGGDCELSYTAMIRALQNALPYEHDARRCRLLPVPTRLFHVASAPLLLHSPKKFEALLRIGSNLSGFTPVHKLLKIQPQPFPVLPLI